MAKKIINWGIIGAAGIAYKSAIPGIKKSGNSNLFALASHSKEKLTRFQSEFGFEKIYEKYDDLLADKEVDAVYIPLPNHLHFEWIEKCVEAGKHVLCEKPIVLTIQDCLKLKALQSQTGLIITEAFMVRYHPRWIALKDKISSGIYGKIQMIEAAFTYHNVDKSNIRNAYIDGGGGLWDIGCYPVHLSRFLTGKEPISVMANTQIDPNFGIDIYANGALDFGDTQCIFQVGTQHFRAQFFRITMEKCVITIPMPFNPKNETSFRVLHDENPETNFEDFEFEPCDHFENEFESVSNAILNNTEPTVTIDDSLGNTRTLLALRKSSESNKRVFLN